MNDGDYNLVDLEGEVSQGIHHKAVKRNSSLMGAENRNIFGQLYILMN